MTRQEANKVLLDKISKVVEAYPDWRFGQILYNLNIVRMDANRRIMDPFYEESTETLEKIRDLI